MGKGSIMGRLGWCALQARGAANQGTAESEVGSRGESRLVPPFLVHALQA